MSYLSEFRAGWRPLLAATLGMSAGFSTTGFITSLMASKFVGDLGWTDQAFAAVGSVSILMSLFIPIAGRLADVWGVRRTAAIGVASLPICMIALSLMNGPISQYYIIFIVQAALCVTTTATVYSRVVVTNFARARGFALAIAASAPAAMQFLAARPLTAFVNENGWRQGYLLMAAVTLVIGCLALWLLPPRKREVSAQIDATDDAPAIEAAPRKRGWGDYRAILASPVFWLLVVAMVFCNLYQTLLQTQIYKLIGANGIGPSEIGGIVMWLGLFTVVGRFICGFAIDRLPGHLVAVAGMGLPAVGLFLLASSADSYGMVFAAVAFLGLAVGAEGDLIGVLVARSFGVRIFGTVAGLVTAAISLATASGAVLLSVMIARYHNYDMFLTITGATTVIGALMFLLMPRHREPEPVPQPSEPVARAAAA